MKQIKPVLEGIYRDPSLRKRVVPIFMGKPGLGKTFLVSEFVQFAKDNKAKFIDFFGKLPLDKFNPELTEYIGSQVSPFEVSGIGIPDVQLKEMVYYNFHKLGKLKDGDVLFFDELPNSNPNVLNALLTLIENRVMMSGDKLPDIMIVAAGNYEGITPMTPQIKRRFVWYDVKFVPSMWKEFMRKKYRMPSEVSNKLCDLIKEEEFSGYNFNTPADIDKATEMIIKGVPTPYNNKIKFALDTLITNKKEDIKLPDGEIWGKGETKMWLELIRYGSNININKNEDEFEISILNENKEVIGNMKNIDALKEMYYFDDEKLNDLKNGILISIPPRLRFSVSFLHKKIK